ncbi:MAG: type II secretion system protein GspN [Myxococcota bacterium]
MKPTRIAAYVGFGILSLIFCLYLTFPWDALKDRLLMEASARTGWKLMAKHMRPSWFTGVTLTDVSATPPGGLAPMELAQVSARAGLWSLLTGGRSVRVAMELGRGHAVIDYAERGSLMDLAVKMDAVELALIGDMKALSGLPLSGEVSADVDLEINQAKLDESTGDVRLRGSGLEIGSGGSVRGFPVPGLSLGSLDWNVQLADGRLAVEQQQLTGGDLEATVNGNVNLATPLERSILNLDARFSPTPQLIEREPLANLLKNRFAITGSLKHPRATPRR